MVYSMNEGLYLKQTLKNSFYLELLQQKIYLVDNTLLLYKYFFLTFWRCITTYHNASSHCALFPVWYETLEILLLCPSVCLGKVMAVTEGTLLSLLRLILIAGYRSCYYLHGKKHSQLSTWKQWRIIIWIITPCSLHDLLLKYQSVIFTWFIQICLCEMISTDAN